MKKVFFTVNSSWKNYTLPRVSPADQQNGDGQEESSSNHLKMETRNWTKRRRRCFGTPLKKIFRADQSNVELIPRKSKKYICLGNSLSFDHHHHHNHLHYHLKVGIKLPLGKSHNSLIVSSCWALLRHLKLLKKLWQIRIVWLPVHCWHGWIKGINNIHMYSFLPCIISSITIYTGSPVVHTPSSLTRFGWDNNFMLSASLRNSTCKIDKSSFKSIGWKEALEWDPWH